MVWDKSFRSYCCNILAQTVVFQLKEIEDSFNNEESLKVIAIQEVENEGRFSDSESDTIGQQSLEKVSKFKKEEEKRRMRNKPRAFAEIHLMRIKSLCYSKRFFGKKYKQPMTASLVSIEGGGIIGLKCAFFRLETLEVQTSFLPINLFEPTSGQSSQFLISFFKLHSSELIQQHLTVSDSYQFEVRKHRRDRKMYSFKNHHLIPLELIFNWFSRLKQRNTTALSQNGSFVSSSHFRKITNQTHLLDSKKDNDKL